jgi:hypothetical protein
LTRETFRHFIGLTLGGKSEPDGNRRPEPSVCAFELSPAWPNTLDDGGISSRVFRASSNSKTRFTGSNRSRFLRKEASGRSATTSRSIPECFVNDCHEYVFHLTTHGPLCSTIPHFTAFNHLTIKRIFYTYKRERQPQPKSRLAPRPGSLFANDGRIRTGIHSSCATTLEECTVPSAPASPETVAIISYFGLDSKKKNALAYFFFTNRPVSGNRRRLRTT